MVWVGVQQQRRKTAGAICCTDRWAYHAPGPRFWPWVTFEESGVLQTQQHVWKEKLLGHLKAAKTFKKLCFAFDSREFNQRLRLQRLLDSTRSLSLAEITCSSKSVWAVLPFLFSSISPYFDRIRCADVAIISTEVLASIQTTRGRCTCDCFSCKQLCIWLIHTD